MKRKRKRKANNSKTKSENPKPNLKGHLNPAVTVGALVANKISCMRAVAYVFMQIAGAIVGTGERASFLFF